MGNHASAPSSCTSGFEQTKNGAFASVAGVSSDHHDEREPHPTEEEEKQEQEAHPHLYRQQGQGHSSRRFRLKRWQLHRRHEDDHDFDKHQEHKENQQGHTVSAPSCDPTVPGSPTTTASGASPASPSSSSSSPHNRTRVGGGPVKHLWHALEDFMFPRSRLFQLHEPTKKLVGGRRTQQIVRGGVLLQGCTTAQEHYAKIKADQQDVQGLHGVEGLKAIGLEFRMVLCHVHGGGEQIAAAATTTTTVADGCDGQSSEDELRDTARSEITKFHEANDLKLLHFRDASEDGCLSLASSSSSALVAPSASTPDLQASDMASSYQSTDSLADMSVRVPSPDLFLQDDATCYPTGTRDHDHHHACHLCMRRLFYVGRGQNESAPSSSSTTHTSNTDTANTTMITEDNRKQFIADGDHYECVANLCQEYAHDVMCAEGDLEWVVVSDEEGKDKEPVRAMVNRSHPFLIRRDLKSDQHSAPTMMQDERKNEVYASQPSLLIATGRGKVRAGIFSRQHLMCTGLESSTALPIVREAVARRLNVVIVDPNINGERLGFDTFQKTMDYYFTRGGIHSQQQPTISAPAAAGTTTATTIDTSSQVPLQARDLYILSHSASGGHMARYLLDKSESYLPHIRAVAFTDSTHNIQWTRSAAASESGNVNTGLGRMLESDQCVYFRCSNVRRDGSQWYIHRAGEIVNTDSYWKHRFGNIRTMWAGTNEHSLTNWYAHTKIWEHFDHFLNAAVQSHSERTNGSLQ